MCELMTYINSFLNRNLNAFYIYSTVSLSTHYLEINKRHQTISMAVFLTGLAKEMKTFNHVYKTNIKFKCL